MAASKERPAGFVAVCYGSSEGNNRDRKTGTDAADDAAQTGVVPVYKAPLESTWRERVATVKDVFWEKNLVPKIQRHSLLIRGASFVVHRDRIYLDASPGVEAPRRAADTVAYPKRDGRLRRAA